MVLLHRFSKYYGGQILVEMLVALAVSAILIPAVTAGFIATRNGKAQEGQRVVATALARQAAEAVRVVRDAGWSNIATDGTYYPVIAGSTWALASGSAIINGYTESVVIGDVSRDVNGNIVGTGGTVDPSTKSITVTVTWGSPILSSVMDTFFLTRLINRSWIQTTVADFSAGTTNNTTITDTVDGEVQLAAGGAGQADWCKPSLNLTPLDLPGQGVTTAISALPGHAYTDTGFNASGHTIDSISISDPPSPTPPVATVSGYYNNYKAYGIFAGTNYIYTTSDHPGLTVDITNASTLTEAGYFDDGAHNTGNNVYVQGNTGYVTAGSTLYTFDVTSIKGSSSQPLLGSIGLAGTGYRVIVIGSYAYVVNSAATNQFQIINVTNPASMSVVSSLSMGNNLAGVDLFVNSSATYAFLATSFASGSNNVFIIDISNVASPKIVGQYSTNGMNPMGLVAVTGNRLIVVGSGGEQYQVLNISNVANPVLCGGLTNPNGATAVNAVASVLEPDGDAFSYILTNTAAAEFQMIAGGPGGQFSLSGTFESSTLDATNSAAFNRFSADSVVPTATSLQYQFAGADPVNGSCAGATFTYVGPDGTGNTKFSTGSAIPLSSGPGYKNPARCFRYKAFFTTTDATLTPILDDITVNYSP